MIKLELILSAFLFTTCCDVVCPVHVRYYPTHKIVFICSINRSAQVQVQALYLKLFVTSLVGIYNLLMLFGQKYPKYKQTHSYSTQGDNVDLLKCAKTFLYKFEYFVVNYENAIEKMHTSFLKRVLNISKYTSNKILHGELARFPLLHDACELGVNYCLRLCNGTKRIIKPVFPIRCGRIIIGYRAYMCSNDFDNFWPNPPDVGQSRLNDQLIQDWHRAISSFSRFSNRRELYVAFQSPEYINAIRNPDIRLIYTILRRYLNFLSTCLVS